MCCRRWFDLFPDPIFHDGFVFASSGYGKGSLTYANHMLYCLDERGIMTLIRASPEKYEVVNTFEVPEGGDGMHCAHPVVFGKRLYIRHQEKLFAYDIGNP